MSDLETRRTGGRRKGGFAAILECSVDDDGVVEPDIDTPRPPHAHLVNGELRAERTFSDLTGSPAQLVARRV